MNDREALLRLLEATAETLLPLGYRKLIAPVGLSPHLSKGVLESHWNRLPPLHTPYNPPYLGELCFSVMRPVSTYRLYELEVPQERLTGERLEPLDPQRLTTDLLPLLEAALHDPPHFFPPGADEAALLLKLLEPTPLELYGLSINEQVVGMVALQADSAPLLKRLEGGRVPFGGWRLERALQKPTRAGRLLFLSVLPEYRQQGLGGRLLEGALAKAQAEGWVNLSLGTVGEAAGAWLVKHGATAVQRYGLYSYSL